MEGYLSPHRGVPSPARGGWGVFVFHAVPKHDDGAVLLLPPALLQDGLTRGTHLHQPPLKLLNTYSKPASSSLLQYDLLRDKTLDEVKAQRERHGTQVGLGGGKVFPQGGGSPLWRICWA